jgi:pimeloyl-ACP methyl ester carboxylesterase
MRLHFISFLLGLLAALAALAQTEKPIVLKTGNGDIDGTLIMPDSKLPVPVVLIIAGSGPTDRDGNNAMMKNNSLKMLSAELAKNGIASVRYDKRGIAKSQAAMTSEADLRFETYIKDVSDWIDLLKQDKNFKEIIVAGHSEGSLIGMVAAQKAEVSKYISIAGVGQPADQLIREQLKAAPPAFLEQSSPILDELVKGNMVENVPQMLNSLFRPSVQPYMISWMKYDPRVEIAKLKKPVLILQGTTDIQVSIDDAKRLQAAKKDAKTVLIEGMNHILKTISADRMQNMQSYNQPDLPLNEDLVSTICSFINEVK